MFAVMGVSGRVGGHTAQRLIKAGHQVRVIVRDLKKGDRFTNLGCEVAVADIRNVSTLTKALSGAETCFLMMPPLFDPSPEFAEARQFASALKSAASTLPLSTRIVVLSTIGAQVRRQTLLSQLAILEEELSLVPNPIVFLRPVWFLENSAIDVEDARRTGVIRSFLQPLDKPVPMVATEDVGTVAASLLQQEWTGHWVVELEGAHRVTPH